MGWGVIPKPGKYELDLPEEYVPVGFEEPPTVNDLANQFFTGENTGVWAPHELSSSGPAVERGSRRQKKEAVFNGFATYLTDFEDTPLYIPSSVAFGGSGRVTGENNYITEVTFQLYADTLARDGTGRGFTDMVSDVLEGESPGLDEITPHVTDEEAALLETLREKVEDVDDVTLADALYNEAARQDMPGPIQHHYNRLNGGKGNLLEVYVLEQFEAAAETVNEKREEIAATVIPHAWLSEKRNGHDATEITMPNNGYRPVGDLDLSVVTIDEDAYDTFRANLATGITVDRDTGNRRKPAAYTADPVTS